VLIEVSQLRSVDRTIEPFDRAFEGSAAVLPLAELSLPDGEYRVVASRVVNGATEPIDQLRLRLRSADEINPAPRQHPPLVRELSAPERAVLTATASNEQGWTMQGPVVSLMGAESNSPQLVPQTVVGVPTWWDERASHRYDAARAERVVVPAVVLDDCFRDVPGILPPMWDREALPVALPGSRKDHKRAPTLRPTFIQHSGDRERR
jgi:hypothetical protein